MRIAAPDAISLPAEDVETLRRPKPRGGDVLRGHGEATRRSVVFATEPETWPLHEGNNAGPARMPRIDAHKQGPYPPAQKGYGVVLLTVLVRLNEAPGKSVRFTLGIALCRGLD